MLIDAHAHMDLNDYANDRAETIERAKEAGVEHIVNVGVEPAAWDESLALVRQYPGYMYLALGIHPNDVHRAGDPDAALERLTQLAKDNQGLIVGLGETG